LNRRRLLVLAALAAFPLAGCQSAYYAAMEKVGYEKRDILQSRVKSARDAQSEAKQEITDALTEFGKVVSYQGGDLETQYKKLAKQLDDSEDAAKNVKKRVAEVQDVGEALFREWRAELAKYQSPELRSKSEAQLKTTRVRYDQMIGAMKQAESRLDPALQPLRDQVLYLKHNLNSRAVAGLKGEVVKVDTQVNQLVADLNKAIAEADRFIADLDKGG
jgi:ElaB/YqjD/DUF883 family membrane-anchored ribosome-binding protein